MELYYAFLLVPLCRYIIVPESVQYIEKHAFCETIVNKDLKIFFESKNLPEDIHEEWNKNVPYYTKGQWKYVNGEPVVKKRFLIKGIFFIKIKITK